MLVAELTLHPGCAGAQSKDLSVCHIVSSHAVNYHVCSETKINRERERASYFSSAGNSAHYCTQRRDVDLLFPTGLGSHLPLAVQEPAGLCVLLARP